MALAGNAVGLIVAALVLDKMKLEVGGFIVAAVVFTVVVALLTPFLAGQMRRSDAAAAALGGVSLIATLAALIVTDLVTDGLQVSGVLTWVLAAVIVWAVSLIAVFVLPYLGLKKYLEERRA